MHELAFQCRHRFASGFVLDVEFRACGEVVALFGPSGSGKSSILNVIAGTLRPQSGRAEVGGRVLLDIVKGVCVPVHLRGVGLSAQEPLLFPHLSVRGNLTYGARRREAANVSFNRLVDVLELSDLLERDPATLSGGQKQRVGLARALLSGPRLLLLDEPFSALHHDLRHSARQCIERIAAEWRIPMILVSHDQVDVRRLADQVVVLENGRVAACGPTAETLDRAAIGGHAPDPAPVNLLRLEDMRAADGGWTGSVGDQKCHIVGIGEPPAGGVWVTFLPNAVTLSRVDPVGVSIRNHLRVRVCDVVPGGGRVFVALDVGQRFWAEVTPAAVRELEIAAGQELIALVKSSAITPLV